MTRNTKIVLGIVAGLLLLCLCGGGATFFLLGAAGRMIARNVVTDPADVAAIADGIAEYQLPAGWREQYGMRFLGFSLVAYAPADSRGHIMLMQFPTSVGLDQATMAVSYTHLTLPTIYSV